MTMPHLGESVAAPVVSDDERARVQRRTLAVVMTGQVLGGAGLAAGISVGGLLAESMTGSNGFAGLPAGLFTLGSASTAFAVGRLTQRWGRRIGLAIGFAVGALGAIGVVTAAAIGSVPLLFVSLFVYGAGSATNLQTRYAGTDLAAASHRGRAVSVAMVSTTFGAVAGPNLITPTGHVATSLGITALAGPFMLAAVAYLSAGTALFVLLRPDPYLLARIIHAATRADAGAGPTRVPRPAAGAYAGATVMILTQIAMTAIMTMTPIQMRAHHQTLTAVGIVIGLHVAAMYLPSPLTGALVDRVGRLPMAVSAALTLVAAGLIAAAAPGDSLALLVLALMLLGLGWNLGLISGTALVIDATVPENRPRTQGTIDVLIALAGATGGTMSGVVMASSSYGTLALVGGFLSLLLVPVLMWARRRGMVAAETVA